MKAIRVEGKRDIKHYIRTTNDTYSKMRKLSTSCEIRPAELSYICLDFVLHDYKFAKEFFIHLNSLKEVKKRFGSRVAPHYLRLDKELEDKLQEACSKLKIAPATFQNCVLEFCLNSSAFVHFLQFELEMNRNDAYRVTLLLEKNKIRYI
ncbi:hypothetical protein HMPREF1207_05601 [Paenibacillus sp. HGH0039]|nr:hypothetical protein HMPREF1207_05601 [Paenibacillus sp. HGH0039]